MIQLNDMNQEQRDYLEGFVSGINASRQGKNLPSLTQSLTIHGQEIDTNAQTSPANSLNKNSATSDSLAASLLPETIAQNKTLAQGKKLCNEEKAKRKMPPLEIWKRMKKAAKEAVAPKGTDVFLYKTQGMFFVAPAQDSFMCRMRFAGGILNAHQLRGIADLTQEYGSLDAHVTTRANLQIRKIKPENTLNVLTGLVDLGVIIRGSGGDNVRNITASPTAGIDTQELIDTRQLAKQMHHEILNRRELYGLPRKFNIAFDGGGAISSLADTNDIGFAAVRVLEKKSNETLSKGVYFRLELGGITGHKDFARDTGVIVEPDQCVEVAAAIIHVFIDHGDRTNRKKARLKYLLDAWGFDKFIEHVQTHLPFSLKRFPVEDCEPRTPANRLAHVGFHPQSQPEKHYVGVVLPVGKLTVEQMRRLAHLADKYGSGTIRLTVWQNLLISDINTQDIPAVKEEIKQMGLHWSATNIRAGLIACTGNAGCKFAAANTKDHATQIADALDARIKLDQPLNIHLTGCHHSCAQHYIGDIGLLATPVEKDHDTMVEGYRVFIGGGYGENQKIGRELKHAVAAEKLPQVLEKMLQSYHQHRLSNVETFQQFTQRHDLDTLNKYFFDQELSPEPSF